MKKLERRLELSAVVSISLSSMLGSGIFVLPGIASAKSGPSIWLAYLTAALCVLPAALSKAELATAMPTSGGTYVYLDRAFGPLVGTVAGLGLWISLLLKCTFALVGLGVYLTAIADVPVKPFALLIIVGIVTLNIRGVRGVSRVQLVLTGICFLTLIGLSGAAVPTFERSRLGPLFPHGAGGLFSATAFVFVSFAGVTKVAAIAEEIRRPERNLPLGILLSLALVTLLYAGISLVLVGCIPAAELAVDLRPIHSLAHSIGGPLLGMPTAVIGAATLASMANAGVLAASRFPFAMSRDNLLPSVLGDLHYRHITPMVSILLSGAVMVAAILLLDVERLAKLASAFMIMIYCSENAAVVTLRETHVQWYKPTFRSPLYPATQVLGVLACLALLAVMGMVAVAAGAAIALAGAPLFWFYGRERTKRMGVLLQRGPRPDLLQSVHTSIKTLAEPSLSDDAAVVVALFGNERSPEMLVELAEALREGGRLEVVHLTEVPEQTDLDAVADESPRLLSIRRRISAMAETRQTPLEFEALVSHDIIKTIDEISSRLYSHWLVMGWTGRDQGSFTIRNPLGWLRDHLSCNLAVFHDAGVRYIREILVHVEPNMHDGLVTDTADHLAQVHGARLTFIGFVPDSAPMTHAQREADYLDQARALCSSPSEALIARGRHKATAIGRVSAGYDLLVTAEMPRQSIWAALRGTGSDRLTETAVACSVLRLQSPARRSQSLDLQEARSKLRHLALRDHLEPGCVGAKLETKSKDEIFESIASAFAAAIGPLVAAEIVAALWERERVQNTAVGMGLALPHATVAGAGELPHIAIFTTRGPVDYQAPDGRGVDVFFATLGSPEARLSHLVVMSAISKLVLETPLLKQLRAATDSRQILASLETCSGGPSPRGRTS